MNDTQFREFERSESHRQERLDAIADRRQPIKVISQEEQLERVAEQVGKLIGVLDTPADLDHSWEVKLANMQEEMEAALRRIRNFLGETQGVFKVSDNG